MSIISEFFKSSLLLCVLLICQVYCAYQLKKVDIPTDLDNIKIFTKEEIAKYDGSDPNRPIYMAVKGVVFDVTSGKGFYGAGESYNVLAGKDASRATAKMSLEPEDITNDVTGLTDEQLENLDQKVDFYQSKYPLVGYMDHLLQENRRRGAEL